MLYVVRELVWHCVKHEVNVDTLVGVQQVHGLCNNISIRWMSEVRAGRTEKG